MIKNCLKTWAHFLFQRKSLQYKEDIKRFFRHILFAIKIELKNKHEHIKLTKILVLEIEIYNLYKDILMLLLIV